MNLKTVFNFLADLKENNNRDWFKENNSRYLNAKLEFENFINILIPRLKKVDENIKITPAENCTFRIFRDVRFSKNKEPYKTNFGAVISKDGRKGNSAGYYIHLEPGASFVGGGIYMPQPKILKIIREEIFKNAEEYKKIIHRKSFTTYFPQIYGEKLKSAPRGFPKDFPDIDLLKQKHYALSYPVDDSFWIQKTLFIELSKIAKAQYPFNQFLNNALEKAGIK